MFGSPVLTSHYLQTMGLKSLMSSELLILHIFILKVIVLGSFYFCLSYCIVMI